MDLQLCHCLLPLPKNDTGQGLPGCLSVCLLPFTRRFARSHDRLLMEFCGLVGRGAKMKWLDVSGDLESFVDSVSLSRILYCYDRVKLCGVSQQVMNRLQWQLHNGWDWPKDQFLLAIQFRIWNWGSWILIRYWVHCARQVEAPFFEIWLSQLLWFSSLLPYCIDSIYL